MYNDIAKNKSNHSTAICSFNVQPHLFDSRQIYGHISFVLVIGKLSHFGKTVREKQKFYKCLVREIKKLIHDLRITSP